MTYSEYTKLPSKKRKRFLELCNKYQQEITKETK